MSETIKRPLFERTLNKIEVIGNKLPDPVTIFVILIVLLMLLSIPLQGISAISPVNGETITILNLFSQGNLTKLLTESVSKFQNFPPLGMVLMVMLGAGVATKTGLLDAVMTASIIKMPEKYVTTMILLIALLADGAGDCGFIILPPLAAMIFASMGKNPLVGMFAAYACVSAGFASDFFINMTDVLFAAFTLPAAHLIDPSYKATPAMNWYYMIAANFVVLAVSVYVTEKVVTPRLNKLTGIQKINQNSQNHIITPLQKKGLKYAGLSVLIMIVWIAVGCIGTNAFMKDPVTSSLLAWESPLMQGMIPLMTLLFLIPAIVYGAVTGSIKNDRDVVKMMSQSMGEMGSYLVIALFGAIFIALFSWSNMGFVLSILSAEWIKNMGLGGINLLIALVLLTFIIGIFIGSASAKWAILAPIFVPMLMLLGYDPAITQTAFRIGDSIANPISPLFIFFPMLLAFAKQYKPDIGMGTIIANMIPFTIAFTIALVGVMLIFILLQLPVGPESGIYYQLTEILQIK